MNPETWKPETWVAIYAAVIGTVAFMLNLKAWWDSGPKLCINLTLEAMTFTGNPAVDEGNLIIVTVTNRGGATTMVTNLCVFEIPGWWRWLRMRPIRHLFIPHPQLKGYPPNVPGELEPAKMWIGAIRQGTNIPDYYTGNFYVALYASHRDRPYLMRIRRKKKDRLPAGTKKFD
jgi:hypothetical protein